MASDVEECSSLDELVSDVIHCHVSLVQIDYWKDIFNMFELGTKPIQEYNQKVDELYETD